MSEVVKHECCWCGGDKYTIEEAVYGNPFKTAKRFYGICPKCYQTTPMVKSPEAVRELIENGSPTSKPSDPEACLWCGVTGERTNGNQNRSYLQLLHQGQLKPMPVPKLGTIHFTICKNCQHCTPMEGHEHEAKETAEAGSTVLQSES